METTLGIKGFFSRMGGGGLGVGHRLTDSSSEDQSYKQGSRERKNLGTGKTKTPLGVHNLTEKPDFCLVAHTMVHNLQAHPTITISVTD